MSYDLRLVIDGYVEHCINQKAQEKYLIKLNAQLDEIEEKADKWVEKETPFVVQEYYSDGRTKQGFCQCTAVVRESEMYCWSCGQRIMFQDKVHYKFYLFP